MNRSAVFKTALENIIEEGIEVYQLAYYAANLDEMAMSLSGTNWNKFRRTETIRLYPGSKVEQAVFYVAHNHDFMPGFEAELVQPLTEPSYISQLDLQSGQVAHLGVRSEDLPEHTDAEIIYRLAKEGNPTMIQKGEVRAKNKVSEIYTIYQVNNFLPVKIVRKPEAE